MAAPTTDVRTLAPRAHQYVLFGIAAGGLAVFAVLAVLVWHARGPIGLDDAIARIGNEQDLLLRRLAFLGSPVFVFTGVFVTATVSFALRAYGSVSISAFRPPHSARI